VRGDGVVGEQPRLHPGQSFQYTSGCVLTTPIGTMHGTYRMWRDDGSYFDAVIAPFSLALPASQRSRNFEAN
jgi:ApaG protein